MKVYIDVGHGGRIPGAISKGILEKDLNLDIATKLNTLLLGKGYDVKINRLRDMEISLHERAKQCNRSNCDLFISIHNNAFDLESVKGAETIYFPTSKNGKIIAETILDNIKDMTQGDHRTAKPDDRGLFVLRGTRCPAVVVECGFMTNPDELLMLTCDTYQWIIAIAIMKGVVDYEEKIR